MRTNNCLLASLCLLFVANGCVREQQDLAGLSELLLLPGACEDGPTGCAEQATCVNEGANHRCDCLVGYAGDGTSCSRRNDISCDLVHGECSFPAVCNGSKCTCPPRSLLDGTRCLVLDACEMGPCVGGESHCWNPEPEKFICSCSPPWKYADDGSCQLCLEACDASKNEACLNERGDMFHVLHTEYWSCRCFEGWSHDENGVCQQLCTEDSDCDDGEPGRVCAPKNAVGQRFCVKP